MRRLPLHHIKTLFLSEEPAVGRVRYGVFREIRTIAPPASSQQFRLGLWERETYKYIRRACAIAAWLIDIGAGDGELSLLFDLRTQAQPIIAVEPIASDRIRKNAVLNGAKRIEIVNAFIGSGSTQVRLDSLSVPEHLPGFVRIDTEGAEFDILLSGERLLRKSRPCLLIETHSKPLEQNCKKLLEDSGYTVTIIAQAWWRVLVPEQRGCAHNRWLWAEPKTSALTGEA